MEYKSSINESKISLNTSNLSHKLTDSYCSNNELDRSIDFNIHFNDKHINDKKLKETNVLSTSKKKENRSDHSCVKAALTNLVKTVVQTENRKRGSGKQGTSTNQQVITTEEKLTENTNQVIKSPIKEYAAFKMSPNPPPDDNRRLSVRERILSIVDKTHVINKNISLEGDVDGTTKAVENLTQYSTCENTPEIKITNLTCDDMGDSSITEHVPCEVENRHTQSQDQNELERECDDGNDNSYCSSIDPTATTDAVGDEDEDEDKLVIDENSLDAPVIDIVKTSTDRCDVKLLQSNSENQGKLTNLHKINTMVDELIYDKLMDCRVVIENIDVNLILKRLRSMKVHLDSEERVLTRQECSQKSQVFAVEESEQMIIKENDCKENADAFEKIQRVASWVMEQDSIAEICTEITQDRQTIVSQQQTSHLLSRNEAKVMRQKKKKKKKPLSNKYCIEEKESFQPLPLKFKNIEKQKHKKHLKRKLSDTSGCLPAVDTNYAFLGKHKQKLATPFKIPKLTEEEKRERLQKKTQPIESKALNFIRPTLQTFKIPKKNTLKKDIDATLPDINEMDGCDFPEFLDDEMVMSKGDLDNPPTHATTTKEVKTDKPDEIFSSIVSTATANVPHTKQNLKEQNNQAQPIPDFTTSYLESLQQNELYSCGGKLISSESITSNLSMEVRMAVESSFTTNKLNKDKTTLLSISNDTEKVDEVASDNNIDTHDTPAEKLLENYAEDKINEAAEKQKSEIRQNTIDESSELSASQKSSKCDEPSDAPEVNKVQKPKLSLFKGGAFFAKLSNAYTSARKNAKPLKSIKLKPKQLQPHDGKTETSTVSFEKKSDESNSVADIPGSSLVKDVTTTTNTTNKFLPGIDIISKKVLSTVKSNTRMLVSPDRRSVLDVNGTNVLETVEEAGSLICDSSLSENQSSTELSATKDFASEELDTNNSNVISHATLKRTSVDDMAIPDLVISTQGKIIKQHALYIPDTSSSPYFSKNSTTVETCSCDRVKGSSTTSSDVNGNDNDKDTRTGFKDIPVVDQSYASHDICKLEKLASNNKTVDQSRTSVVDSNKKKVVQTCTSSDSSKSTMGDSKKNKVDQSRTSSISDKTTMVDSNKKKVVQSRTSSDCSKSTMVYSSKEKVVQSCTSSNSSKTTIVDSNMKKVDQSRTSSDSCKATVIDSKKKKVDQSCMSSSSDKPAMVDSNIKKVDRSRTSSDSGKSTMVDSIKNKVVQSCTSIDSSKTTMVDSNKKKGDQSRTSSDSSKSTMVDSSKEKVVQSCTSRDSSKSTMVDSKKKNVVQSRTSSDSGKSTMVDSGKEKVVQSCTSSDSSKTTVVDIIKKTKVDQSCTSSISDKSTIVDRIKNKVNQFRTSSDSSKTTVVDSSKEKVVESRTSSDSSKRTMVDISKKEKVDQFCTSSINDKPTIVDSIKNKVNQSCTSSGSSKSTSNICSMTDDLDTVRNIFDSLETDNTTTPPSGMESTKSHGSDSHEHILTELGESETIQRPGKTQSDDAVQERRESPRKSSATKNSDCCWCNSSSCISKNNVLSLKSRSPEKLPSTRNITPRRCLLRRSPNKTPVRLSRSPKKKSSIIKTSPCRKGGSPEKPIISICNSEQPRSKSIEQSNVIYTVNGNPSVLPERLSLISNNSCLRQSRSSEKSFTTGEDMYSSTLLATVNTTSHRLTRTPESIADAVLHKSMKSPDQTSNLIKTSMKIKIDLKNLKRQMKKHEPTCTIKTNNALEEETSTTTTQHGKDSSTIPLLVSPPRRTARIRKAVTNCACCNHLNESSEDEKKTPLKLQVKVPLNLVSLKTITNDSTTDANINVTNKSELQKQFGILECFVCISPLRNKGPVIISNVDDEISFMLPKSDILAYKDLKDHNQLEDLPEEPMNNEREQNHQMTSSDIKNHKTCRKRRRPRTDDDRIIEPQVKMKSYLD